MKIYGSPMCPDCVEVKRNFDHYGIEYDFIDINESLSNLKEFLVIRDEHLLDYCRETGDIGLPTLVFDDGEVTIHWEAYLEGLGRQLLERETIACSIDGHGC